MTHGFGWRPDKPDIRDYKRRVMRPFTGVLPSSIDLRDSNMPPICDQLALGSCTANGIAGAVQYERRKQGLLDIMPSRLFIYYNERVMEGTVTSDAGAEIRDGIKSINAQGVCPEVEWPYDVGQFAVQPPDKCYTDAKLDISTLYMSVDQTLDLMKQCLASKFPIVGGFTVYSSFENVGANGLVPMPGSDEGVLGGHCTDIVGYLDSIQRFIVRNSWGTSWGDQGYCYMPYDYWTNQDLADDFWAIELIGSSTGSP